MNEHVLFIQGGGGKEDYEADAKLVASLRETLGKRLYGALSALAE